MNPDTLRDDPAPVSAPMERAKPRERSACDAAATRSPRWQFVYTVAVAFAIVALQMGQGILLARLLGPEGRGQYATAVFYVQMLLYIGMFGGMEVICRHAAEDRVDTTRLRRSALWLGITTGAVTTAVCLGLCLVALPAEKRFLMPMAILCSLSVIGQHVMLIMTAVDRGCGQFTSYNILRVIAAAAFPSLLLIAACITAVDLVTTCSLFVVASLVSMVACVIGLPRPLRGPTSTPVPTLLRESRPYAFSMFVTDLFERLDLLLVLWLAPLIQQGYYAAMVPVAYPLTVIPNTLGMFLFNAGARRDQQLSTADVHRILGSSLAVQVATTIAFMLVIGPVVRLLYGEAFAPAVTYALWLAPIFAIRGVVQGLDAYLKGRGRPLAPIRVRVLSSVVTIVATWLLLESFETVAIAMAALAGQVVCLIGLIAIVYADVRSQQPMGGVE